MSPERFAPCIDPSQPAPDPLPKQLRAAGHAFQEPGQ